MRKPWSGALATGGAVALRLCPREYHLSGRALWVV
jgi:hypothetical protein